MEFVIYLMVNLGFGITFFLLGGAMLFLHMPKDEALKNYRVCRYILGTSFILMALYCVIRIFIEQNNTIYEDFWVLLMFSMTFAWLNYTSFLFAISTSKKITRSMLIDGLIPLSLMFIVGLAGVFIPAMQYTIEVIFVAIYLIKCTWMFITCMKEWKICNKEIQESEHYNLDIRWMKATLILLYIVSWSSVTAFFIPEIHVVYAPGVVILFTFLTFKIINFMPKRMEQIRSSVKKEEDKTDESVKPTDFADKIGPKVDIWVMEKRFCRADLTIKDVAQEIGTNQNYLSAYLNRYKNANFQLWLNTLRIEESKELLLSDKHLSIEEIGAQVGIPQNYNFSKWFKTITEMTPYQFRKSNHSPNADK